MPRDSGYSGPEQVIEHRASRSVIYALSSLYEVLTSRLAATGKSSRTGQRIAVYQIPHVLQQSYLKCCQNRNVATPALQQATIQEQFADSWPIVARPVGAAKRLWHAGASLADAATAWRWR